MREGSLFILMIIESEQNNNEEEQAIEKEASSTNYKSCASLSHFQLPASIIQERMKEQMMSGEKSINQH